MRSRAVRLRGCNSLSVQEPRDLFQTAPVAVQAEDSPHRLRFRLAHFQPRAVVITSGCVAEAPAAGVQSAPDQPLHAAMDARRHILTEKLIDHPARRQHELKLPFARVDTLGDEADAYTAKIQPLAQVQNIGLLAAKAGRILRQQHVERARG
ncbi:MAG TPA: hypothetical protein VGS20_05960 [Candidatus Acidoferrales bacterium]|nr:hypothetical protein [Candidatus Acidoferrales bacterium]